MKYVVLGLYATKLGQLWRLVPSADASQKLLHLIRGGMPIVNVSAFLGHNQVSTTLDIYSHVLDNERGKASEAMGSYMESLGFCSGDCSGTAQSAEAN